MNEQELKELESKLALITQDELKSKFKNLYIKYLDLQKDVDHKIFTNKLYINRFKYLTKTYTTKPLYYNFFLEESIKNKDQDLKKYLINLYNNLELEAEKVEDYPLWIK